MSYTPKKKEINLSFKNTHILSWLNGIMYFSI